MSSAIAMACMFVVILLIISSLFLGIGFERRHLKQSLKTQPLLPVPAQPLPGARIGQQPGLDEVTGERLQSRSSVPAASAWYMRRRTLVSLGLLTMFLLTFLVQTNLTEGTLRSFGKGLSFTFSRTTSSVVSHVAVRSQVLSASERMIRIDSAARDQYYSDYQWQSWSYSSCSGIAMATVMNAYGRHLIAADVLQEEANLGVWNVDLGLLSDDGIGTTASYFGFSADISHSQTIQAIVAVANSGKPVIVSVRDPFYFPGGHIFVIRGGDGANLSIVDSSPDNFQHMSYTMFAGMWEGMSAVLTPVR